MAQRVMQNVDVWPPSGHLDRPWDGDPDADAFCRSARSVTVSYSVGLRALRLPGPRSVLRFACGLASTDDRVHVTVVVNRPSGDLESAGVSLPVGVAAWAPADRARLVLEVVHAGMARLGAARGWDAGVLERLRDETLQGGLEFRSLGPWKTSPGRRYRARTAYRIDADGLGRVRVEVANADGEVLASSEEVIAGAGFTPAARLPKALRWSGSDRVGVTTMRGVGVHLEQAGQGWRGLVVDDSPRRPPLAGAEATPGRALPELVTVGSGVEAEEETPIIRAGGGGPVNGVSPAYLAALEAQLHRFADPAGQAWWQDAGIKELQVHYHFGPGPDIRSRRAGARLRVEIRRPAESTHLEPAVLAADDLRALVAEVRRKTGLGPHPMVDATE